MARSLEELAPQILSDLIALPTVNPMERPHDNESPVERPVHEYLETLFAAHDVGLCREACSPIHENLLIDIKGQTDGPATLFESHVDTVPADDWPERAFEPRAEHGRVYGRGACDDKGSLAAMAVAALSMLDDGDLPPQPVLFLAAGDEELGQTGIRHFGRTYNATIARGVFGEPTSCQPIIQHKGCVRWDIVVHGRSSHSAHPDKGQNAIHDMMQVIDRIRSLQEEFTAEHNSSFISRPTITVTMIQGGQTRNSLPARCQCSVDLRQVPGMECDEVSRRVIDAVDALGLETEHRPFQAFTPALSTALNDPLAEQVLAACRAELDETVNMNSAAYCSDASWMPLSRPAVLLGPGNIEQAHAIDEYVDVDEVIACARIYKRLMLHDWTTK